MVTIELKVNGRVSKVEVGPYTTLLEVLRDKLAVTSPKAGCNTVISGPGDVADAHGSHEKISLESLQKGLDDYLNDIGDHRGPARSDPR